MTIKQFLKIHVEGYLFKDLRTMGRIKLRKGQKIGGVGYPMVLSILAGMEMLGGLLQKSRFSMNPSAGTTYFEMFWNDYLSISCPSYIGMSNIFRQLIRNGVAHTYLTKTGIWIKKGDPTNHLKIFQESSNYYLVVDIKQFFDDFEQSYMNIIRPIVYGGTTSVAITKNDMQARLDEMIADYEQQSNRMLSAVGTSNLLTPMLMGALTSGASLVNAGTVIQYSGFGKNKP